MTTPYTKYDYEDPILLYDFVKNYLVFYLSDEVDGFMATHGKISDELYNRNVRDSIKKQFSSINELCADMEKEVDLKYAVLFDGERIRFSLFTRNEPESNFNSYVAFAEFSDDKKDISDRRSFFIRLNAQNLDRSIDEAKQEYKYFNFYNSFEEACKDPLLWNYQDLLDEI